MRRISIAIVVLAVGLTGCGTGVNGESYIGTPGSLMWSKTSSPATQTAYYQNHCTSYGFAPGTQGMAYCIQQEAMSQRAHNDATRARITAINRQIAASNAQNRRVTCHRFGNNVNCW